MNKLFLHFENHVVVCFQQIVEGSRGPKKRTINQPNERINELFLHFENHVVVGFQ